MSNFVHTTKCKVVDAPDTKWGRKLVPYNEKEFRWLLLRFNPDTDIIIGAKPFRAKHSPEQRGYLHGVVVPAILEKMGYEDSKDNHAAMYLKLKEKFGQCDFVYGKDGADGEVFIMPKTMKESDTAEMHQLIEGAIRWAGEFLGLDIPPPQRMMLDGAGI